MPVCCIAILLEGRKRKLISYLLKLSYILFWKFFSIDVLCFRLFLDAKKSITAELRYIYIERERIQNRRKKTKLEEAEDDSYGTSNEIVKSTANE